MKRNLLILSTLAIIATACDKTETEPSQPYDKGVLVVNSGNFFDNNGSITLIQRSGTTASYDIFQKENLRAIAGGISGYTEVDDKGLILVDNSTVGKDAIEIVNARTFKSVGVINEVENPRNAVKVGTNKAYVVCWDSFNSDFSYKPGYVAVIDLVTNKLVKKIPVQNGSDEIVVVGNEAFVANTPYSNKKEISVINTNTDTVISNISLNDGATNLTLDLNKNIWCVVNNEIIKINPQTKNIDKRVTIGTETKKKPSNLVLVKSDMFFEYSGSNGQKGVFSFNIDNSVAQINTPIIKRTFSSLGYDSKDNVIYAGIIPSYKQAGYVFRYNPTGTLIDSVKAEIAPSKFYFKK